MLPATHRLTEPEAYARTVRSGRRAGSSRMVVHLAQNSQSAQRSESPQRSQGSEPATARIGLVVNRAVGNAVVRNRVKRRLRHLSRDLLTRLPQGATLVVRALPPAASCSSSALGQELDRLVERCQREPREGAR